MANFQESRILGLSPRAVWLTLAVVAVVVALFFIPPAIKFLFEGAGRSGKAKAPAAVAVQPSQSGTQKAALNTEKLQQVSTDLTSLNGKPGPKSQQGKKVDNVDQGGGFFSGWNFKVKARGGTGEPTMQRPSGLTLEKLGTKEAQNFFKAGVSEIKRFMKRERIPMGPQEEAMMTFSSAIGELAAGVKGVSNEEIVSRLAMLHAQTLRELSAAGADRGRLLSWLSVPVVGFVDDVTGVEAARQILAKFSPRMILISASIREQTPAAWGLGQGALARAQLEMTVHGSDVDKMRIINNGKIVREIKLKRPDENGDQIVRVAGDATGIWTFVAMDKFGARPYSKSYAFYPRVQAFPQSPNGDYEVSFEPSSARFSLDKFFFIGSSGNPNRTSDPVISQF
jgi:hypothetical protein